MLNKTALLLIFVAIVTFLSGWFLHQSINNQSNISSSDKSLKSDKPVQTNNTSKSNGDRNIELLITGRYVLEGSNCAGFDFINKSTVLWTNEISCNLQDSLKIRWLNKTTFITRSTERINESCPPRVDVYQVKSFDGKHLVLNTIWTGWNDFKDEQLDFIKQSSK